LYWKVLIERNKVEKGEKGIHKHRHGGRKRGSLPQKRSSCFWRQNSRREEDKRTKAVWRKISLFTFLRMAILGERERDIADRGKSKIYARERRTEVIAAE